jgi:hypothetical protein
MQETRTEGHCPSAFPRIFAVRSYGQGEWRPRSNSTSCAFRSAQPGHRRDQARHAHQGRSGRSAGRQCGPLPHATDFAARRLGPALCHYRDGAASRRRGKSTEGLALHSPCRPPDRFFGASGVLTATPKKTCRHSKTLWPRCAKSTVRKTFPPIATDATSPIGFLIHLRQCPRRPPHAPAQARQFRQVCIVVFGHGV